MNATIKIIICKKYVKSPCTFNKAYGLVVFILTIIITKLFLKFVNTLCKFFYINMKMLNLHMEFFYEFNDFAVYFNF